MNKEELIKIYSAYLPYGLEVQLPADDSFPNKITKLSGIMNFGLLYLGSGGRFGFTQRDVDKVKPVLYDLSYFTNEIEHEGKVKILGKEIFKREWEDLAGYYVNCNQIMKLSYHNIHKLLEHHFNIFGLKEDQFINKATLNK